MRLQLSEGERTLQAEPVDETAIWQSLLNGDRRALGEIYTRYFDKLYNYGSKISHDAAITEDAIQDLFIELWNRRQGLNDQVKSIKFYLYTCLRREIVRRITKQNPTVEISELESFEVELSHKSHYLSQQIDLELKKRLAVEIDSLTPKQREAIFLIYFDELSYPEVAEIMSLKIKTVYNLIHLAINRLKGRREALGS